MSSAPATGDRSPRERAGSAVRGPGRPRSTEADSAIIAATLQLLVSDGYRALTMEKVRERAGVGKATIYRRYAAKEDLVRAAVVHLNQGVEVPEDTGALRSDFMTVARAIVASAEVTGALTFMPRMLAEVAHDPELRRIFYDALVQPRRDTLETILRRAVHRGEIRDDVDLELAIDLIAGPMIYRILITGGDLGQLAERPLNVLDAVLDGLRPR
jgi:AcrR family transcriptional regulator